MHKMHLQILAVQTFLVMIKKGNELSVEIEFELKT